MFPRITRSAPSHPLSFLPSLSSPQKRRRQPSDSYEPPPTVTSESKNKVPRRIDPDRLAIRLGPELTKEMDAFIVPGAKMPTFPIRQQLVKKYNVDRRHIYDYFHSRGLRVSKEDKHQNLSHRMSKKPAASRRPKASRVISSDHMDPVEPPTAFDSPVFEPAPASSIVEADPAPAIAAKSTKYPAKRRTTGSSRQPPAPKTSVSPFRPSLQSMDISSDSSGSEDGDSPMFDFTDTLTASSSFALTASSSFEDDLQMLSLGYPLSDAKLRETFGPDFTPFPPTLPEDPLLGLGELQLDEPETSSKPPSDALLLLDNLSRLSEKDRIEFYNLIDAGIGPARGIEECAGTYKAHMDRLYSNRFYLDPQPLPLQPHRDPCSSATTHTAPHLPTVIEKENRPPMSASRPVVDSQSSNKQYYRHAAAASSPLRRRNSHYPARSPRRTQPALLPLPTSTTHFAKPLLLPSISTPNTRSVAPLPRDPRPHPTALIWTSPIRYSPLAPHQPPTLQWPAHNPFPISAFYTPTGDRIIYHSRSLPSGEI
ncbi:hypothetical protein C8F04DRAFT_1131691 [Mycena alexandri]|uniref:Uncharacterized protein n=1 Tax=Mycena alexandri TaxID=1745969 RepID=A0AAD6WX30_9AGAR|nr:hypothetical protein C8F04DRAFT_1131691 [Mycena alexandri]